MLYDACEKVAGMSEQTELKRGKNVGLLRVVAGAESLGLRSNVKSFK